jgi:hypothetical protein
MPASPPVAAQISQVIPAARSYVHFPGLPDDGHNDHQVIAWVVLDDNITVVPLIASTDDAKTIVQASQISDDYTILNPYSECSLCVRPP